MINKDTNKVYVWSLATRLFHIFLILSTAISYLISDFDSFLFLHASFGYVVGFLFIFRLIWGFFDIKYSSFKDFNFKIKDLIEYLLMAVFKHKEYVGHNPASSWAIVLMIAFGILATFTGMLAYGSEEQKGLFSFLGKSDIFEDIHELFSNIFMLIVLAHIAGVLMARFLHKGKEVESMIAGYKNAQADDVKITLFQNIFAFTFLLLALLLLIYTSF